MDEMSNRHFKALGELELTSVASPTFPTSSRLPVYQDGDEGRVPLLMAVPGPWPSPGSEPGKKD